MELMQDMKPYLLDWDPRLDNELRDKLMNTICDNLCDDLPSFRLSCQIKEEIERLTQEKPWNVVITHGEYWMAKQYVTPYFLAVNFKGLTTLAWRTENQTSTCLSDVNLKPSISVNSKQCLPSDSCEPPHLTVSSPPELILSNASKVSGFKFIPNVETKPPSQARLSDPNVVEAQSSYQNQIPVPNLTESTTLVHTNLKESKPLSQERSPDLNNLESKHPFQTRIPVPSLVESSPLVHTNLKETIPPSQERSPDPNIVESKHQFQTQISIPNLVESSPSVHTNLSDCKPVLQEQSPDPNPTKMTSPLINNQSPLNQNNNFRGPLYGFHDFSIKCRPSSLITSSKTKKINTYLQEKDYDESNYIYNQQNQSNRAKTQHENSTANKTPFHIQMSFSKHIFKKRNKSCSSMNTSAIRKIICGQPFRLTIKNYKLSEISTWLDQLCIMMWKRAIEKSDIPSLSQTGKDIKKMEITNPELVEELLNAADVTNFKPELFVSSIQTTEPLCSLDFKELTNTNTTVFPVLHKPKEPCSEEIDSTCVETELMKSNEDNNKDMKITSTSVAIENEPLRNQTIAIDQHAHGHLNGVLVVEISVSENERDSNHDLLRSNMAGDVASFSDASDVDHVEEMVFDPSIMNCAPANNELQIPMNFSNDKHSDMLEVIDGEQPIQDECDQDDTNIIIHSIEEDNIHQDIVQQQILEIQNHNNEPCIYDDPLQNNVFPELCNRDVTMEYVPMGPKAENAGINVIDEVFSLKGNEAVDKYNNVYIDNHSESLANTTAGLEELGNTSILNDNSEGEILHGDETLEEINKEFSSSSLKRTEEIPCYLEIQGKENAFAVEQSYIKDEHINLSKMHSFQNVDDKNFIQTEPKSNEMNFETNSINVWAEEQKKYQNTPSLETKDAFALSSNISYDKEIEEEDICKMENNAKLVNEDDYGNANILDSNIYENASKDKHETYIPDSADSYEMILFNNDAYKIEFETIEPDDIFNELEQNCIPIVQPTKNIFECLSVNQEKKSNDNKNDIESKNLSFSNPTNGHDPAFTSSNMTVTADPLSSNENKIDRISETDTSLGEDTSIDQYIKPDEIVSEIMSSNSPKIDTKLKSSKLQDGETENVLERSSPIEDNNLSVTSRHMTTLANPTTHDQRNMFDEYAFKTMTEVTHLVIWEYMEEVITIQLYFYNCDQNEFPVNSAKKDPLSMTYCILKDNEKPELVKASIDELEKSLKLGERNELSTSPQFNFQDQSDPPLTKEGTLSPVEDTQYFKEPKFLVNQNKTKKSIHVQTHGLMEGDSESRLMPIVMDACVEVSNTSFDKINHSNNPDVSLNNSKLETVLLVTSNATTPLTNDTIPRALYMMIDQPNSSMNGVEYLLLNDGVSTSAVKVIANAAAEKLAVINYVCDGRCKEDQKLDVLISKDNTPTSPRKRTRSLYLPSCSIERNSIVSNTCSRSSRKEKDNDRNQRPSSYFLDGCADHRHNRNIKNIKTKDEPPKTTNIKSIKFQTDSMSDSFSETLSKESKALLASLQKALNINMRDESDSSISVTELPLSAEQQTISRNKHLSDRKNNVNRCEMLSSPNISPTAKHHSSFVSPTNFNSVVSKARLKPTQMTYKNCALDKPIGISSKTNDKQPSNNMTSKVKIKDDTPSSNQTLASRAFMLIRPDQNVIHSVDNSTSTRTRDKSPFVGALCRLRGSFNQPTSRRNQIKSSDNLY